MLSRGGRREYLCPDCKSTDIEKVRMHGQSSYFCNGCNTGAPWCERKTRRVESQEGK